MKIIAVNIEWDTDGEDINLPREVEIPSEVISEDADIDEYIEGYAEEVEDYLFDNYGFCVFGFNLEMQD